MHANDIGITFHKDTVVETYYLVFGEIDSVQRLAFIVNL